MSARAEYWTCPHCRALQDISQVGFFAEIACHQCGAHAHVHSMLSNYKVEAVLGIGGMSVVFKARDLILGRPLAIKVLNDAYRDAPERIAGFENECSFMAKVRHENVVSVYSAGWARGQFFIAMELVEGRNLELIVKEEGRLDPLLAIEIIRQVALGLQAAHEAGILHRDVKPGNVLIAADGRARVLDFGLSLEEKDNLDEDEIIWATPYYVPPETLRREEETVRTDIYALGMTLRNLLTGEELLPGNPQHLADMLVAKKTLPRLQDTAPEMDGALCRLVDALTAFEPAERPANYAEVLRRVAKVQQRLQDEADPAARRRRRLRKVYTAAGALASVALGGAGAFVVALHTPSRTIQETLEPAPLRLVEPEAYREAEAALKAGSRNRVPEALGHLTAEGTEPALAAAAMVLRTAVDVMEGKASANGYNRFAALAEAGVKPCEPGAAFFAEMSRLVSALQTDAAAAEEIATAVPDRLLRAAALVLVADAHVRDGNPEQALRVAALAREVVPTVDFNGWRAWLDEYAAAAPRRAARVYQGRVKDLYREGKYGEAASRMEPMRSMKLSAQEWLEVVVLKEAADIMCPIIAMMNAKQRRYKAGMKPEALRTAATGLGPNVPAEFYSLALLLAGDYDAAFRENPYADKPDSKEPFAIMMRDWKSRLNR